MQPLCEQEALALLVHSRREKESSKTTVLCVGLGPERWRWGGDTSRQAVTLARTRGQLPASCPSSRPPPHPVYPFLARGPVRVPAAPVGRAPAAAPPGRGRHQAGPHPAHLHLPPGLEHRALRADALRLPGRAHPGARRPARRSGLASPSPGRWLCTGSRAGGQAGLERSSAARPDPGEQPLIADLSTQGARGGRGRASAGRGLSDSDGARWAGPVPQWAGPG